MSSNYADLFEVATRGMNHEKLVVDTFLDQSPKGRIADFGAGQGRLVSFFKNRELFCVENNQEMLRRLAEKHPLMNDNIVNASGLNTPFEDNSFAGVHFSPNAICEMSPIYFVLHEACRVVDDNGVVFFSATNPLSAMPHKYPKLRLSENDQAPEISHVITYPTPMLGAHSFETKISVRTKDGESYCVVSQIFPDPEYWINTMKDFGFDLIKTMGNFSSEEANFHQSQIITYCFKRSGQKADCGFVDHFYDGVANKYSELRKKSREKISDWFERSLENTEIMPYARFLDLGCGPGVTANAIKVTEKTCKIFGLDLSKEMVKTARKTELYESVARADLSSGIPILESSFFDFISAISFLEFIKDPRRILDSIFDLLAPGGKAWLTFEKKEKSPIRKVNVSGNEMCFHSYDEEEVLVLLKRAGFTISKVETKFAYEAQVENRSIDYIFCEVVK